jgi:hypothetical protein
MGEVFQEEAFGLAQRCLDIQGFFSPNEALAKLKLFRSNVKSFQDFVKKKLEHLSTGLGYMVNSYKIWLRTKDGLSKKYLAKLPLEAKLVFLEELRPWLENKQNGLDKEKIVLRVINDYCWKDFHHKDSLGFVENFGGRLDFDHMKKIFVELAEASFFLRGEKFWVRDACVRATKGLTNGVLAHGDDFCGLLVEGLVITSNNLFLIAKTNYLTYLRKIFHETVQNFAQNLELDKSKTHPGNTKPSFQKRILALDQTPGSKSSKLSNIELTLFLA